MLQLRSGVTACWCIYVIALRRTLTHMPIFSLVHTKGGVAKTTSAVYLATAAHRRGIGVELIDAEAIVRKSMKIAADICIYTNFVYQ